jgi:hypothetical protein
LPAGFGWQANLRSGSGRRLSVGARCAGGAETDHASSLATRRI